jgi:protein disulfide-isomerase A1
MTGQCLVMNDKNHFFKSMLCLALAAVLGYRIKGRIGEMNNLILLFGKPLQDLIKKSAKCIVIFLEEDSDTDFLNFGIKKYKSEFVFIRALSHEAEPYNCISLPCVVAFANGKRIETPPLVHRAAEFVFWLRDLATAPNVKVEVAEELRLLLSGSEVTVFGVDMDAKPRNAPPDLPFYLVNASTFGELNVTVEKGLYIWRPADRELIPFAKGWKDLLDAGIQVADNVRHSGKAFFAGFIVDNHSPNTTTEISVLKRLHAIFNEQVAFSLVHGETADVYSALGQFESLEKPFFFVFNMSDWEGGRWVIYDDNDRIHNPKALEDFLKSIINNKEPFSVVSEKLDLEVERHNVTRLVALNLESVVIGQTDKDVLLAVVGARCGFCPYLLHVLNEVAGLLKEIESLQIVSINGSRNDLPEWIGDVESYPVVRLWPAGQKDSPVEYKGPRKVNKVIEFLVANAGKPFEVPEYNLTEVEERIQELSHPKRKKETEKET